MFLHGMPYAIAPDVQTKVPMMLWSSQGFAKTTGLDLGCLRQRAQASVSHDHLFHTVLGLLDVSTALYEPQWDFTAGCRRTAPVAQRRAARRIQAPRRSPRPVRDAPPRRPRPQATCAWT
ncbi:MAG TPA: sulfatase-like hydrolase/transferase [Burkholderiaceae bacterium]